MVSFAVFLLLVPRDDDDNDDADRRNCWEEEHGLGHLERMLVKRKVSRVSPHKLLLLLPLYIHVYMLARFDAKPSVQWYYTYFQRVYTLWSVVYPSIIILDASRAPKNFFVFLRIG